MCSAHSGSGKWDEDSQHWALLWAWDQAVLAPLPVHRVPLIEELESRATDPVIYASSS